MRIFAAPSLAVLLALSGARAAWAADAAAGTAAAPFLKLGASARAGAMADAFTAVSDDVFAGHYNPAGLASLTRSEIGGSHTALFQGVTYQSFAFAYPFGREEGYSRHALGLGVLHLGVGGIQRRTGDSTDAVGTFNASDAAYAVSYARAFTDRLFAGASAKLVSRSIDTYSGTAAAADFGVLYRATEDSDRPLHVGAALRHFGQSVGYVSSSKDPLPTTASVGAAWRPLGRRLLLSAEAGKARDASAHAAGGVEARKAFGDGNAALLRAGYNSSRRDLGALNGLSAGAGLSFPKADFDLAWVPFGTLGDSFRFGLRVKF